MYKMASAQQAIYDQECFRLQILQKQINKCNFTNKTIYKVFIVITYH